MNYTNFINQKDRPPTDTKYTINIFDNFDFYDGCDKAGPYDTHTEAIAAAKSIINKSLKHEQEQMKNPGDPKELIERWDDFGANPSIQPAIMFNKSKYVAEQAEILCASSDAEAPSPST